MLDRANDALQQKLQPAGRARAGSGGAAGVPVARRLGRWTCALAGGLLLSLTACGGSDVKAGPTGGVMKSSDAMGAQEAALKHCRKYGKSGRITGPLGDDTYSFVCE